MPFPVRVTLIGPLVALLVMLMVSVLATSAVGEKVTLMLQLSPTASVGPQVVVREKPSAGVLMLMLVSVLAALLLRISTCAALVLLVTCQPKSSALRLTVAVGFKLSKESPSRTRRTIAPVYRSETFKT